MKKLLLMALLGLALLLTACGTSTACGAADGAVEAGDLSQSVTVSGDGIEGELSFTMEEMLALDDGASYYEGAYSTINNWPTAKPVVAGGIKLEALLRAAGVWDRFQLVTLSADDGYSCSFTREQLLAQRWYYPEIGADAATAAGAAQVPTLLAWLFAEDETDPAQLQPRSLMLVFGQRELSEHNYVGFVENVTGVTVSDQAPEAWAPPYIYPDLTEVAAGDSVKLQHEAYGQIKIYYTLDGSEPTRDSAMYNPSTYQPDLNVPLTIEADTQIKAFVSGFGRSDSPVVVFDIKVK